MADIISEVGGQLVEKVFSGIIWIGLAFILVGAIGGVMYYFVIYRRKFDIRAKVTSNRANDKHSIFFDDVAIIKDRKTKTKYFKFWNLKKELPIPPFNVLQITNKGDYLELERVGESDFKFLTPPKVCKTHVVDENGRLVEVGDQETNRIDIDLDYWGEKRKKDNNQMFDTESLLMKLLPYMPALFTGVIMIFILYILLDHLPGILEQLKELYQLQNNLCRAEVITG